MNRSDLKKGDRVFFGRTFGEKTLGEIVKLNPKRAKVRTLEARGRLRSYPVGSVWVVPYSLLSPASPADMDRTEAEPAKPRRPEAQILADLRRVENMLEPEHLYADGERSHAAAQRLARSLNRERRDLVRELGREPTDAELWPRVSA